jgi:peptidoglycan/LPS O-acetylase OafA/YrhL
MPLLTATLLIASVLISESMKTDLKSHYPGIDYLRGIAILSVLIYHCFDFVESFRFGWMGVDLFFVLSGFLITDILIRAREHKNYIFKFYIRRALRILPIYLLVLLAFLSLAPILFNDQSVESPYGYYTTNQAWFFVFMQNWLMIFKGAAPVPYLSHFWSLAVEEQFYLFWPLLLLLIPNLQRLKQGILLLIPVILMIRILIFLHLPVDGFTLYTNTFTRMDTLLMGAWLCIHLHEGKNIAPIWLLASACLFVASILFCVFYLNDMSSSNSLMSTVGFTINAFFFTGVVYVFIQRDVLSNFPVLKQFLNFIGKISYGIYVYHLPIYLVLAKLIFSRGADIFNSAAHIGLIASSASIFITIAISYISYRFIETPFLNLKKYFA